MRLIQFSTKDIQEYYHGDFSRDLQRYFTIEPSGRGRYRRDYPIILHMASRFNKSRDTDGSPALSAEGKVRTCRNFIFSGIFYFMLSIPQTIRKVCGEVVEKDFYRCSGWPLSSAGMGGYLPPKQMMEEASLLPWKGEEENYYVMMNVVAPFMIHEISEFLLGINSQNINVDAYNRFYNAAAPHALSLINRITAESRDFANEFIPRLTALRGDIFTLDESKYDAAVAFVHGGFNGFDCMLMVNKEKIESSKIGYVIYRDNAHRGQPYRTYKSNYHSFSTELETIDYIKKMIPESLDFALKCGQRIAFHGLQIHGWDQEKNEKLSVSVVRGWLNEHPEASVTMVDIRGCFSKYLIEIH